MSGHHLMQSNGKPFFWLADTAWVLFHELTREEADVYLRDRAEKGFTVIQAQTLMSMDFTSAPNRYNQTALINNDLSKPNEAYFQHVDYIVNRAAQEGLYVALSPSWGQCWDSSPKFSPDGIKTFATWMANRYKGKNIIWITGGDCAIDNSNLRALADNMAAGIRDVVGESQLVTYHPLGGRTSSEWFQGTSWLNFNMMQTGHEKRDNPNYKTILNDWRKSPTKPALDAEAPYEDHPVNWIVGNGRFDDFDIRQTAYWAMMSGAAGHTYGNNNIFWFFDPSRSRKDLFTAPRQSWRDALNANGGKQMSLMRALFDSRPMQELTPDPAMVTEGQRDDAGYIAAIRGKDYAYAYFATGGTATLDLSKIAGDTLNAWWFDPRTGKATAINQVKAAAGQKFDPPGDAGRYNDWVLVIDAVSSGRKAPNFTLN